MCVVQARLCVYVITWRECMANIWPDVSACHSVCVCVCERGCVCVPLHARALACTQIPGATACMWECACMCVFVCVRARGDARVYGAYTRACFVCVLVCVCMCVCVMHARQYVYAWRCMHARTACTHAIRDVSDNLSIVLMNTIQKTRT